MSGISLVPPPPLSFAGRKIPFERDRQSGRVDWAGRKEIKEESTDPQGERN